MKDELDKAYSPTENENKIYEKWEKSGYFNPDNLELSSEAPSYTIVLPPPNITAKLHLGHSAMLAIEDLLIRYKRLKGFRTLWLPGTDHAAIATQNAVEKKIFKETGKTRHDLGRDRLLEEVWSFLKKTQGEILVQTRSMGASLDWSRLAFTLDDERQQAVKVMFKEMYEAGAIYRGERMVNWCPRCHSTLADDEVEYKEEHSKLYWIKYGPFVLATSRPETKLGDTAVAVHPDDIRYQKYIGQELEIPGVLGSFTVKVVADKAVEMEFGSGVIKVTPAHSFIDSEIAARHNISGRKIINEDGRMMANCGKYAGLTTAEAREAIVADMDAMGLIDHIDDNYIHNSARCYRCDSVIEPLPSEQWFIGVDKKLARLGNKSLKERALEVAQTEEITFVPDRFKKRYLDWMTNLHDWCISRQIWFGHQIPVWYRGAEVYCGLEAPEGADWRQDTDTLDTWFSSGMWTFSTLGWPDNFKNGQKTGDLAKFHPTQVLETGYEIITLWVSRMIMMSLFALNEIPFSKVYLHGMVLDKNGKKMSKSKGNGIDPIEMIEKFGADAVRLSLLMGFTPGNDNKFSEERIETKRNFINKLWNISRFILSSLDNNDIKPKNLNSRPLAKSLADNWILEALQKTINAVDKHIEDMNFSLAADELNDFTWNKLADWYLEIAKIEKGKSEILLYILRNILILWHPFIPFVTEKIWSSFNDNLLMVEKWPEAIGSGEENNNHSARDFNIIQEIIIAIRNVRSENKIEPARKLPAVIYGHDLETLIKDNAELIKNLKTGLESLEIKEQGEKINGAILAISGKTEIYLLGAVDKEKEEARLLKEKANLEKLLEIQKNKLANKEFMERAPEKIVALEKEKITFYQQDLEKIIKALTQL
ncbi:MAG: valine--tRNA ligase [Candidatus Falkowbacteria bacterium]|nr:MAG: valine--tRNA ligase [Candidatus Falkowbacteria bacterium]